MLCVRSLVAKHACAVDGVPCGDSLAYVITSNNHILTCHLLTQLALGRNHYQIAPCTSLWHYLWLPSLYITLLTLAVHKVAYALPLQLKVFPFVPKPKKQQRQVVEDRLVS